ncbi:zinc finger CCHC domain-containing protein 8 homolog [Anabrus simplex]|uniref:zinc finger CCHC domain-containing protein 8 homolog n=1 Tax=Anabrus simplex TaxID=316456 RepID=UPI0034DDA329
MADKNKLSSVLESKRVVDELINDSSSMSCISIDGESADSDCNGGSASEKGKPVPISGMSPLDNREDLEIITIRSKHELSLNDSGDLNETPSGSGRKVKEQKGGNGPIISITFRNEEVARKYRKSLKLFLKDLIKKHDPESEECDISDLELDIWEDSQDEEILIDDSSLFTIDKDPASKISLDVPTYSQKYSNVLQENKETPDKEKKERTSFQTCFNCLGDHSVRDCPKKRDGMMIAKNRRAFMSKHGPVKASRYHLDDEQRFAHITPGEISDQLRRALGLSRYDIPKHIYQMRMLGYPPGWLEEAKVSHSGLLLFDDHGNDMAHPDDEEGEIIAPEQRDRYDLKKIISFPGFNVKPKSGTRDNHEYLGYPPMKPDQSKEAMLSQLEPKSVQAYKRRKLQLNSSLKSKLEESPQPLADMEVEEIETVLLPSDDDCRFIPPLPKEEPQKPPPPPSTESDSEGGESRSLGPPSPLSTGQSSISSPRGQSPSLSDLEVKKNLLLTELEDGGSSSDTTLQKGTPQNMTTPTLGRVKSVALGTPLLKSTSPYSNLPEPIKFSKDICDVINFENLPDATGKYEQMTGLIKKVRTVVQRIQNENDK